MPTFEPWDIVKVPFPYADRPVRQRRPALVVAAGDIQTHHSLVWVLMITSADNRAWPSDVAVSDLATAGLPAASVVRTAKVAVIDLRDAERLGTLPKADRSAIAANLSEHLGGIVNLIDHS
jgi:mRNA interferase MazF